MILPKKPSFSHLVLVLLNNFDGLMLFTIILQKKEPQIPTIMSQEHILKFSKYCSTIKTI